MRVGALLFLASTSPALAQGSLQLPTGIELTGQASATLECTALLATIDGKPEVLKDEKSKFTFVLSPVQARKGVYRDFYFHQPIPADWQSTKDSLSFALWIGSAEKRADVSFFSGWGEDGAIRFRSTIKMTFEDQSKKPMTLDRHGTCELLIDMHPETKQ